MHEHGRCGGLILLNAVAHREFLRREDNLAAIDNRTELEVHLWEILWALDTFQSIQQFLAASCLAAALACFVAANKLFSTGNMFLLCFILTQTALHAFLAQLNVSRVVAGAFFDTAKSHFNGRRDDSFEEGAGI